MPNITIQLNSTDHREIAEAQEFLAGLAGEGGVTVQKQPVEPQGQQDLARLARVATDDLWNRTGRGHHELVITAASIVDAEGSVALADLAEKLDQDLSVIVSRFANLGALNESDEDTSPTPRLSSRR